MPVAENLSKGFSVPTTTGTQPVVQPPTATSTQSFVQPPTQPSSDGQLAIPSIFGQIATLPSTESLPESQVAATSYIFASSFRSDNYKQQQAMGLEDGDFALSLEGATYKLDPLKYFLCQVDPFVTQMGTGGVVTYASRDMDNVNQQMQRGEHYLCLVLVFHNGRLIPAKAEFRTTKSSAAKKPLEEIHLASKPEWLKTDAHRVAAQCAIPWGRVVATSVPGGKKTSRSSGNPYIPAVTNCRPATSEEMLLLAKESQQPDFSELFNLVTSEYNDRKTFLDSRCR